MHLIDLQKIVSKKKKQKTIELQGKKDKSIIIAGDFKISFLKIDK